MTGTNAQGRQISPNTTIPQQEIWDTLASQLAREPAPEGGRTQIVRVRNIEALEAQLQAIVAGGGRVSQIDWVGHGSTGNAVGFHLYGVNSADGEWVSAADMVRLIATTGIARGATSFQNRFYACYSDMWINTLTDGLRARGVLNPRTVGQYGDFTPAYGPRAGHPNDPRSRWIVNPGGRTVRSGEPPPSLTPSELCNL